MFGSEAAAAQRTATTEIALLGMSGWFGIAKRTHLIFSSAQSHSYLSHSCGLNTPIENASQNTRALDNSADNGSRHPKSSDANVQLGLDFFFCSPPKRSSACASRCTYVRNSHSFPASLRIRQMRRQAKHSKKWLCIPLAGTRESPSCTRLS